MGNTYLSKQTELELGEKVQKGLQSEAELNDNETLTLVEKKILQGFIREGEEARNILFENNINLVHHRARIYISKYPNSGLDYEDLIQEGQIGLIAAINKYDPKRENKLSTVAYYWITQAITRAVNKTGRLVRLPENRIVQFYHINKFTALEENLDKSQADLDKAIIDKFDITIDDLYNIRSAGNYHASLNMKIGDDEGGKELIDFFEEDETVTSTEETVIDNNMNAELLKVLSDLSEVKQRVIESSFSLQHSPYTEKTVREKFVMKKRDYEKIKNEAVQELREKLTQRGLTLTDFIGG